jgi:hypothetical protein
MGRNLGAFVLGLLLECKHKFGPTKLEVDTQIKNGGLDLGATAGVALSQHVYTAGRKIVSLRLFILLAPPLETVLVYKPFERVQGHRVSLVIHPELSSKSESNKGTLNVKR